MSAKIIAIFMLSILLFGCIDAGCGDGNCDELSENSSNCPQDCKLVAGKPAEERISDCGSSEECFKTAIKTCTKAKVTIVGEGTGLATATIVGESGGYCRARIEFSPPPGVEGILAFECTYYGLYYESAIPVNFVADENATDLCREFVESINSQIKPI
ncbi:MAG: hypothetical protein ABID38_04275 [Candidatus Diapherotrites archaeon]